MKIINAIWELRNLGVTCTEVLVEPGDQDDAVLTHLNELPLGYQVVKVPVARVGLMNTLQRAKFTYIESSIRVEHGLEIKQPEGLFNRMVSMCDYVMLGNEEIERVSREIQSDMFTTDRVSLDPKFTREQASNRYVNWMFDVVSRGGSVYELRKEDNGIGFFLFQQDSERVGNSPLAGLYPSSNTLGFGNVLLHLLLVEAKKRKLRRMVQQVSTNNPAVVKNHMEQGFKIRGIHYVFVRHAS
jgi:hypothetical protein